MGGRLWLSHYCQSPSIQNAIYTSARCFKKSRKGKNRKKKMHECEKKKKVNCMIIYMNWCKTKVILGSWKLWFSYINENLKKIKISACFRPIFNFELKGKRSRAEPSWKSFSSSSGSSQLGSDSSLLLMYWPLHTKLLLLLAVKL